MKKTLQKLTLVLMTGLLSSSIAIAAEPDPAKMKKLKGIMMHQLGMV